MDGEACNSTTLQQLPTALQLHVLSFLPPDDRALGGRLVSPDVADALSGAQHCTASLSQPLPPHAVPWALEAGQQHVWQLPFRHKLQLMCTAAASGSEVNLEVALALLQPSIFPDVLQQGAKSWEELRMYHDPGVAAIEAGHPKLLGRLLRHCPGLLHPDHVLEAAARLCDLAGLQAARRGRGCGMAALPDPPAASTSLCPNRGVLDAAAAPAGSATQDAEAKIEWVLSAGRNVGLRASTADLAVAQWTVDEAGCGLPPSDDDDGAWYGLMAACAQNTYGVAKLQWLRERGAPPLHADCPQLEPVMQALAEGGQVDLLQYLLQQPSEGTDGTGPISATRGRCPVRSHPHGTQKSSDSMAAVRSRRWPSAAPRTAAVWPWSDGWWRRQGYPRRGRSRWRCATCFITGPGTHALMAGTCCMRCGCWWARRGAGCWMSWRHLQLQRGAASWPWCSTVLAAAGSEVPTRGPGALRCCQSGMRGAAGVADGAVWLLHIHRERFAVPVASDVRRPGHAGRPAAAARAVVSGGSGGAGGV